MEKIVNESEAQFLDKMLAGNGDRALNVIEEPITIRRALLPNA